jgi:hypothetical protein
MASKSGGLYPKLQKTKAKKQFQHIKVQILKNLKI